MNRLQTELQRLYLAPGPEGQVRSMVLELARPAEWDLLARVWRGVQADLQLPAPAIAVSGTEGMQLWFSLQEPASASAATIFLRGLGARYLAGVAPARLTLSVGDAAPVPALQEATGNWSAFIAPDLAPVFVDTPWLDIPPGAEGQADLLARLQSIKPAAFEAAVQALAPAAGDAQPQRSASAQPAAIAGSPDVDPERFLQQVLNDESAAPALRIEAAKALLRARRG